MYLLLVLLSIVAVGVDRCSAWWMAPWSSQCYDSPPVGCFHTSAPFNGLAPESPQSTGIRFRIYTSARSKSTFTLMRARRVLIRKFNPQRRTIIIIHGYMEGSRTHWIRNIIQQLFLHPEPMNVLVADWTPGASRVLYAQSVANARVAGALVALLVEEMTSLGADVSRIHLVGFSLGAHMAGYAGERIPGLGRITGLDPAGPSFHGTPPEARLDSSDATIVDVIHTGATATTGVGTRQRMGTVDFYPNKGLDQPGCPQGVMNTLGAVLSSFDLTTVGMTNTVLCSHTRAPLIFAASINNGCFRRTRWCSDFNNMLRNECEDCQEGTCPTIGFDLGSTDFNPMPGMFDVQTTGQWPYC